MKEMNSTFFIVIAVVVVFLLLLLFFQTSCDNKNNEKKSEPFKGNMALRDLGDHAEKKPSCQTKLGECEGDCDKDDDCYKGLQCYQRDTSSDTVPGCKKGGPGDDPTHDYCYFPSQETNATLYIQVDDDQLLKFIMKTI